MSLADRATSSTSGIDPLLEEAQRLAPGWLIAVVWPLLKIAAVAADATSIRRGLPVGSRWPLLAVRSVDWLFFLLFPVLVRRTRSAAAVSALTLIQAASTAEAIRRLAPQRPGAARLLVPQLAWLLYASAVPPIVARRVARSDR